MNYSKRLLEIILGFIILFIIIAFLMYIILKFFINSNSNYMLKLKFNEVGGLTVGSQVLIKGVVVGSVNKISINNLYNVEVCLNIYSHIKIPKDSKALIKDTSLFSGRKIEILPGTSKVYLTAGDELIDTIDYLYLEDKISSMLFNNEHMN